ncbi:MAG: hypothetical protein LBV19_06230 [Streptococcaceae bacterium]|nr:hypothetical protein [Streptococcaceae bacterium]
MLEGQILTKLSIPQLHLVNEAKANHFMLERCAKDFLGYFEIIPEYIDVHNFLKTYGLSKSLYDMAYQIFHDLLEPYFANKNPLGREA